MKPRPAVCRWLERASLRPLAHVSTSLVIAFGATGVTTLHAADINWTGTTGTYNAAGSWAGGAVPGINDNAISTASGTVQILPADPTWFVNDLRGVNGNFTQSGSRAYLGAWLRMGVNLGSTGIYTMSAGRLEVPSGNIRIGEIGTGTMNFSGGEIYHRNGFVLVGDRSDGPNTTGVGTVNQTGGTLNTTGEIWVGYNSTASDVFGTYNLTSGSINLGNWFLVGRTGGDGQFTMNSGTLNKSGINGQFVVGSYDGGTGSTGVFTQSAGTVNIGAELWIGQGANANSNGTSGRYDMNGGKVEVNNWIACGRDGGTGVMNIAGGTIHKFGGGAFTLTGTGTVNQTGGLVNLESTGSTDERNGSLIVGEFGDAVGIYNLGSTGVLQARQTIVIANNDATTKGTFNLNSGGTLKTGRLYKRGVNATSVATANFDGGTLVATGDEANFISGLNTAEIKAGGLIIDSNSFTVSVPQAFTGSGQLIKNGRGTVDLTGGQTITSVQVNQGLLDVDSSVSTDVTVAAGAALSGSGSIGGNITLGGATPAVFLADSTAATPLNVFSNVNATNARIDFSNASVAAGTYTVLNYLGSLAGTFTLGRPGSIDTVSTPGSVLVTVGATRNLTWTGATNTNWDVFSANNWNNGATPAAFGQGDTVDFGNPGAPLTVSITDAVRPANIALSNANTITWQGTANGDIAGSAVLSKGGAGKLIVGLDTSLNANVTTPVAIPSTVTISAGEIQVGNGGATGSLGNATITDNSILSFNLSANRTYSNPISGTGAINKSGTGTVTLTGPVSYSGTTNVSGGRLVFKKPLDPTAGAVLGTGAVTLGSGSELEIYNNGGVMNINSVFSGAGKLLKSGPSGEVWLNTASPSFTGNVEVMEGPTNPLNITNIQALGTSAGKTTVHGGNGTGGIFLNIRALGGGVGGTFTISEPFELLADSFGRAGIRHEGGTTIAQVLNLTGPITVGSTGMSAVQFSNLNSICTLNLQGDISGAMNGGQLFLRGSTGPINVTGAINISDHADLTVTDAAVVRFGASGKTYQNFRTNLAFGSLRTVVSNVLPDDQPVTISQDASSAARLIIGDALNAVASETIGGLISNSTNTANSGVVNGTTSASNSTLTINQGFNSNFNLAIGGSTAAENRLAIVKSGKGRLVLGANTHSYTGPTTVSDGSLIVNGNASTGGLFTVAVGATLGGAGATGNLTVNGTVAPGNLGIGTLATKTLTLNPNSIIEWQVGNWTAGGNTNDQILPNSISMATSGYAGNQVKIKISNPGAVANFTETDQSFVLADTVFNIISNFSTANFIIDATGFTAGTGTWAIRADSDKIYLDYTHGIVNNYGTWANTNNIGGELPTDDHDQDGLSNLMEYGVGSDPRVPTPAPGTFVNGVLSYPKGATAVANGDVTWQIQTSTTLGAAPSPWTAVTASNSPTSISYGFTPGPPRVFARLVVTKSP